MEYCEKCKVQCPEWRCPVCGSDRLREVQNNDYCLLTECSRNFGEMVRDVFEQNGIQGAFVPFGRGTRSALGLDLEQYRIYVPYERQKEARQIVECFCFDNTEDWREQTNDLDKAESFINNTVAQIVENVEDGDIILMHELYKSSYEIFSRAADKLIEMGYEFVTVSEMLELDENSVPLIKMHHSGKPLFDPDAVG